MTEESETPVSHPESIKRVWLPPYNIALITMWLLTTVILVVMLFSGVRNSCQFRVSHHILQAAYVLTLFGISFELALL